MKKKYVEMIIMMKEDIWKCEVIQNYNNIKYKHKTDIAGFCQ